MPVRALCARLMISFQVSEAPSGRPSPAEDATWYQLRFCVLSWWLDFAKKSGYGDTRLFSHFGNPGLLELLHFVAH